jgi:uncharacterized protein (TIGR02646 family)
VKHIAKDIKNEPLSLRAYRNTTPNARYDGYTDKDSNAQSTKTSPLKTALAQEQGYICCYCMRRISEEQLSVEHYISQNHHISSPLSPAEHKQKDLDFLNMLASCNRRDRNCSGLRGNIWLTIDPRKRDCEQLLRIDKSGKISSANPNFQKEVEQVLRLNTSILIANRRSVIQKAIERLKNIKKTGFFTDQQIQKEIDYWLGSSRGQYREYCMAAVHYLQSKIQKAQ